MAQVFISYSSADKAVADRVCGALEGAGATCWIAPRNIEPGLDYPAAIVEAVGSARVLVLVLTEQAAASPHILSEVGHAFSGKKPIIPFRLSTKALPENLEYFLSMTQWLDAPDGCTDDSLKRLTQATLDALAGRGSLRRTRPGASRARWLVVALAALAVALGTMVYWKMRKSSGANPQSPYVATGVQSGVSTSTSPRKIRLNPLDGQNYVWIPPGTFMMGCSAADSECKDDEKPTHLAKIDKGFWIGQTEVTVAAYRTYAAKHSLKSPPGEDTFPATGMIWAEAKDYCAAVGGRLPTEAEWEYAARGGSPLPYYDLISEIAWYEANSGESPHPVGKKKPNGFGLYDMLGNVSEWVLDRYYNKYYLEAAATGPDVEQPLASNSTALTRGGSWMSPADSIRVSRRIPQEYDAASPTTGLRCASDRP